MNRREFLATSTAALVATTIPVNISASPIEEVQEVAQAGDGESITIRGSTNLARVAIKGVTHEDTIVHEYLQLGDPTKFKYKHLISVCVLNKASEMHDFEIHRGDKLQSCFFVAGGESTHVQVLY